MVHSAAVRFGMPGGRAGRLACILGAALWLGAASAACTPAEDALGDEQGDPPAFPQDDPVAVAIERASVQLPNVIWDGQHEPSIVRYEPLPAGYVAEVFSAEVEQPAAMAFAPDGRLFVTEQHAGTVRIISPDGTLLAEPFATLPDPAPQSELGTIGIAIHPDFPDPAWVYVFHVHGATGAPPTSARIYRFRDQDGAGVEQQVIAELPASSTDKHNGGRLAFGPDGKLYVTIGDLDQSARSQDLGSLAGKVLRLNDDGSAPDDNPFAGRPDADARIYAFGLRNTFGMAWHPELEAWVGADNAVTAFDELNIIEPGRNYGHPAQRGYYVFDRNVQDVTFPAATYLLAGGIGGIAYYGGDLLDEFRGDLFMCQIHRGTVLHRIRFEGRRVASNTVIATGCASDVQVGPDGAIYYADVVRSTIHRLTLAGG